MIRFKQYAVEVIESVIDNVLDADAAIDLPTIETMKLWLLWWEKMLKLFFDQIHENEVIKRVYSSGRSGWLGSYNGK